MSKYFKEVTLDLPAPVQPQKLVFPEIEAFRPAIDKFRAEIGKIQMGTSDYVIGAIQFPKGICIPATVLDRFYSKPCEETLKSFLEACQQDFGIRAAKAIAEWFSEFYPKTKEMVK